MAIKETTKLKDVGVPGGPLKQAVYDSKKTGGGKYILTECPVCGKDLTEVQLTSTHIAKHDPEDFGLTPLGEI